jgi:hypothetical protein
VERLVAIGCDFDPRQIAIVCRHVTDGQPIAEVAHDLDRVVQVLCARHGHDAADAQTVHLHHLVVKLDALDLPRIDPGRYAQLSESAWIVLDMPLGEGGG